MPMERHKCKLCSRTFNNGRALGGHMKAHLATLPLPPKPQTFHDPTTESASASLSYETESEQSEGEEQEEEVLAHQRESEEKPLTYGLRENPKKSLRLADPEFSFVAAAAENGFAVVQDRESETESKNPTRQRSKRNRKTSFTGSHTQSLEPKKPKLSFMESPEPVSSVSDFSPEEDVALCLMMLSRDMWNRTNNNVVTEEYQDQHKLQEEELERTRSRKCREIKLKRVRGKQQCENCGKKFRSSRALGSHRSICCRRGDEEQKAGEGSEKIFECPFCFKVFGSGQALGGHKRSHLMASSSSTANKNDFAKLKESFIDLNLPAPAEEDELSVVSDVSVA